MPALTTNNLTQIPYNNSVSTTLPTVALDAGKQVFETRYNELISQQTSLEKKVTQFQGEVDKWANEVNAMSGYDKKANTKLKQQQGLLSTARQDLENVQDQIKILAYVSTAEEKKSILKTSIDAAPDQKTKDTLTAQLDDPKGEVQLLMAAAEEIERKRFYREKQAGIKKTNDEITILLAKTATTPKEAAVLERRKEALQAKRDEIVDAPKITVSRLATAASNHFNEKATLQVGGKNENIFKINGGAEGAKKLTALFEEKAKNVPGCEHLVWEANNAKTRSERRASVKEFIDNARQAGKNITAADEKFLYDSCENNGKVHLYKFPDSPEGKVAKAEFLKEANDQKLIAPISSKAVEQMRDKQAAQPQQQQQLGPMPTPSAPPPSPLPTMRP